MFWYLVIVAATAVVYYLLTKPYKYWPNLGVQQGKPVPILGDNWGTVFRVQSFADFVQYVYNMGPGKRYSGFYQFLTPTLVLRDPELIKQITVKDFDHFTDHRAFIPEGSDPLWGKNLFALTGKRWRDMRATLSPSFTSSKMRAMFALMTESAETFVRYFNKQNEDLIEIEMKDTFTRFTNDVIATTAFGIRVDSMEEKNNEFYMMGKEATNFSGWWKNLKFFGFFLFPSLYKIFKVTLMGQAVNRFFISIIKDTIKMREEKNIVRPDMINLLLEARKGNSKHEDTVETLDAGFATAQESEIGKAKVKMEITDVDIAAQALIFFFAGFDSVSALMCFNAYELAANPDIQSKLRDEIMDTDRECKGKLTYEALLNMKYMDMVISETLRKWPNAVAVDRVCTKPYTIEPTSKDETPIPIELGTTVWLPIYALHRDPEYFPDPDRFDPERFSDENKANIKPYTYIPFGSGPRNCIGSRFALLETKAVFYHILKQFEIVPVAKTTIPLQLSRKSFNLTSEGGFWFGFKRITN